MYPPRNILIAAIAIAAALGLGYGLGQKFQMTNTATPKMEAAAISAPASVSGGKDKILYYRAPMGADTSPVPKKDEMGMDYVPVYATEVAAEPGTVALSARRMQQLGVRTEIVVRRNFAQTVDAVGTVQIDETRQIDIAPRFDGWIEKLYAGTTGMQVKKGAPLFTFYSPQLTNIEAEYPFSTSGTIGNAGIPAAPDGNNPPNGTIEKLQNLAVPVDEIARLRRERSASYHITLRAPADGTIVEKNAIEGMKFTAGDTLYRLVDLSNVWIMADVYEQDLARIAVGQTAKITINTFPGRIFEGKISFIYPGINKDTRTAKVRIDLPNPTGELRLDMYADVHILGTPDNNVLVIPASAVLDSGKRQVVLIDLGGGYFRPQPVEIGMRAGNYFEILKGLKEGDRVVTSANFLIDSESNLRAALQAFAAPQSGAAP